MCYSGLVKSARLFCATMLARHAVPLTFSIPLRLVFSRSCNRSRTKILQLRSFFSSGYALFQVPYPLSPLFATLAKTAGCVPKIPNLELSIVRSPTLIPYSYSPPRKSFNCNTYGSPRKCCKQKTYGAAKPFRCNTYKKQGGWGCYG
jgi:hypothetical protein